MLCYNHIVYTVMSITYVDPYTPVSCFCHFISFAYSLFFINGFDSIHTYTHIILPYDIAISGMCLKRNDPCYHENVAFVIHKTSPAQNVCRHLLITPSYPTMSKWSLQYLLCLKNYFGVVFLKIIFVPTRFRRLIIKWLNNTH